MNLDTLREKLGYHGILLGLVGLGASAALATADHFTHADIAAAEIRDIQASLKQVLPEGFADNDLLQDVALLKNAEGSEVKVYRARLAGQPRGAVFQVASRGYAGDVEALLGVDRNGAILGVRVVKHQETPGLGDKIELAKSRWILSFDGKSLGKPPAERFAVKKDGGIFDQFAGATITPRAVVKAVKGGLEFYAAHRDEILKEN